MTTCFWRPSSKGLVGGFSCRPSSRPGDSRFPARTSGASLWNAVRTAVQQRAVGGLEAVGDDARVLRAPGRGASLRVLQALALLDVSPAALHDQGVEDAVGAQRLLGLKNLDHRIPVRAGRMPAALPSRSLVPAGMKCARRLWMPSCEANTVVGLPEQLDHVAEVVDGVVDRRGGEQKHLLGPLAGLQVVAATAGSATAP